MGGALLLIPRSEVLTIPHAAKYARRSPVQIRRWCKEYGISRQVTPTSPHEVSKLAIAMLLHGDFDALDKLKAGHRASPEVQRYVSLLVEEG